ncbi:MAG: hypothetical protein FWC17_06870, partial [Treponema sp.]|nr:hypothetical protein [Treponema sp.]
MRRFVIILSIILIFPFLLAACRSQPDAAGEPEITFEAEAEIQSDPELIILEPILEVISIVILQADIVVTEFEATLRITNPNEFAVALSELTYQLYGNGMFWAEGAGSGLLDIPPLESAQSAFRFNMNFINMNRRLLDDVINMREV